MRREQLFKVQERPIETLDQADGENKGSFGSQKLGGSGDPWSQQIRAFTLTQQNEYRFMVFDDGSKEAFTEDTLVILAESLG